MTILLPTNIFHLYCTLLMLYTRNACEESLSNCEFSYKHQDSMEQHIDFSILLDCCAKLTVLYKVVNGVLAYLQTYLCKKKTVQTKKQS